MKKVNTKKLALNRETLVTLSPDALEGVIGGRGGRGGNGGNTFVQTFRIATRYLCPQLSNLACPSQRCNPAPQAPAPQAGGQGGDK